MWLLLGHSRYLSKWCNYYCIVAQYLSKLLWLLLLKITIKTTVTTIVTSIYQNCCDYYCHTLSTKSAVTAALIQNLPKLLWLLLSHTIYQKCCDSCPHTEPTKTTVTSTVTQYLPKVLWLLWLLLYTVPIKAVVTPVVTQYLLWLHSTYLNCYGGTVPIKTVVHSLSHGTFQNSDPWSVKLHKGSEVSKLVKVFTGRVKIGAKKLPI